ncbi:MAG: type II toxin-antitoxin system prevent-host-death family antitoxin [Pseudomonadota bacterium]
MSDETVTEYHMRLPMAKARERLAEMVVRVQDPRFYCVLTRHGRPVAAVVSMEGLRRIHRQEDRARVYDGRWAPGNFFTGKTGRMLTDEEASEAVQKIQLDRLKERRILARTGLRPVPGGEVEMEATPEAVAEPARRRAWWRLWR